jgi:hypothetical protein
MIRNSQKELAPDYSFPTRRRGHAQLRELTVVGSSQHSLGPADACSITTPKAMLTSCNKFARAGVARRGYSVHKPVKGCSPRGPTRVQPRRMRRPPTRTLAAIAPPPTSRERVLGDDELKAVWVATDALKVKPRVFVRLLVMTTCREMEAADIATGELDLADPGPRMASASLCRCTTC